ncbi:hypothetical protein NDU88_003150 [Pleurodeles waltl]|uniref:Uncharacterized protein n=1 Tax=Pleurodeles waltl TaxID=8319 RepID=A0AAV7P8P7_PLEWA|nr:hypothetical protein NDU88_003150 [Pleurodeles waltl]
MGCPRPGHASTGHLGLPRSLRGPQGPTGVPNQLGPPPLSPFSGHQPSSTGAAAGPASAPGAVPPPHYFGAPPVPGVVFAGQPQHNRGPRPLPVAALLRRPMGRIFSQAPGPPPAPPLQRGDSTGVPRCSRAVRLRPAAARGSTRGRGFSREDGPPAFSLTAELGPLASTLWGRLGGPIAPRIGPQFSTSVWIPVSPEMARFSSIFSRPLRSEEIRRTPSPDPWPRPTLTD